MNRAFRAAARVAALAAAAAALGCATAPAYAVREPIDLDRLEGEAAGSQNTIIVKQTQLTIPEGWAFQWKKDDDSSVFFRFFDREDNVEGSFEYIHFDFDIDPRRAAIAYATDILKGNGARDIVLRRAVVDGNPSTIITATDGEHGWDIFTAVIGEGRRNLNVIRILSNQGWLFAHPEVAYRIFASYRYSAKSTSQRTLRGLANFYCDEDKWVWVNDVDAGFVVSGRVREDVVTIILERTKAASAAQVESTWSFGKYNLEPFAAQIVIDGRPFQVTGAGRRDVAKGYVVTSYLIDRGGDNVHVTIGYDEASSRRSPFSPETIHKEPEVVEFFARFLSLSGDGPRQTFGRCVSDKDCSDETICEKGLCTTPAPRPEPAAGAPPPATDAAPPAPEAAPTTPQPGGGKAPCDPVKGCPIDFSLPPGAARGGGPPAPVSAPPTPA